VGATAEKRVDVRVLAATNVNLQERVEVGGFRKDLYFRITGYDIELKPLRERREDVELFIAHFLERFAGELKRAVPALSTQAHQALMDYEYPGNIRELKSIIERALIESGGKTIDESHLHLLNEKASERSSAGTSLPAGRSADELPLDLETAEIELVKRALAKAEGNVSKAAQFLGINRTKVYRILSQSTSGR
jgi:transcriptional regulator with PAS, ATPase and Fis domain